MSIEIAEKQHTYRYVAAFLLHSLGKKLLLEHGQALYQNSFIIKW